MKNTYIICDSLCVFLAGIDDGYRQYFGYKTKIAVKLIVQRFSGIIADPAAVLLYNVWLQGKALGVRKLIIKDHQLQITGNLNTQLLCGHHDRRAHRALHNDHLNPVWLWRWQDGFSEIALNANTAPYNADWSVEYVPASAENIKLIRGGETKNIANTGAGTIVKLSESKCYLKLEQWMIGDVYPISEGDVLVVEGEFKQKNGDYAMVIDKTYIVIGSVANDEVTFTTHYEDTAFGAVVLPTSTDTLNIGMWNGSHHAFEHKQLQDLKDAGITKIMGVNTQWIGTEDVNAWLDRVYSYGIRVIMDLRDWDGTTVPSYANHPGLIGFLMYDELSADVFDDLAALKAKFNAVMPADKLFYVNLSPECAANSSLGTESNWWESIFGDEKDYDADCVTAFLDTLDIEVLSWDNYSLLNGNGIRTEYCHNFEVMAGKNLPMWYTMLSTGHPTTAGNTYATPTAEELRWQMAIAAWSSMRMRMEMASTGRPPTCITTLRMWTTNTLPGIISLWHTIGRALAFTIQALPTQC